MENVDDEENFEVRIKSELIIVFFRLCVCYLCTSSSVALFVAI